MTGLQESRGRTVAFGWLNQEFFPEMAFEKKNEKGEDSLRNDSDGTLSGGSLCVFFLF